MKYQYQNKQYIPLLKEVRKYFDETKTLIWDRRNKIKIVIYDNKHIAVKSFKLPHLLNRIVYGVFRDSKAKRSYDNSLKLKGLVPEPIGYVEYHQWGMLQDSYFLSEEFMYDFTIREVLLAQDFSDRLNILEKFSYFTYMLHETGAEHLDYSPGNILIKKVNGEYQFKVIDINRMRFGTLSMQKRLENFAKLWASDTDLKFIAASYAKWVHIDEQQAVAWALKASHRHKSRINMKKRLKGKPVVD